MPGTPSCMPKWGVPSRACPAVPRRRKFLKVLQKYILTHQADICRVASRDSGKVWEAAATAWGVMTLERQSIRLLNAHARLPECPQPAVDAAFGEILVTCEKIAWLLGEGERWLLPEKRSAGKMMFYKVRTPSLPCSWNRHVGADTITVAVRQCRDLLLTLAVGACRVPPLRRHRCHRALQLPLPQRLQPPHGRRVCRQRHRHQGLGARLVEHPVLHAHHQRRAGGVRRPRGPRADRHGVRGRGERPGDGRRGQGHLCRVHRRGEEGHGGCLRQLGEAQAELLDCCWKPSPCAAGYEELSCA